MVFILWLAGLVVLIVTLSHASRWVAERQQAKAKEKKSRSRQERHSERYRNIQESDERAVAARVHAITNQLERQQENQTRQDKRREFREWFTISALLIAGVTAFASDVILYCQLIDARSTSDIQHKDTVRALRIAEKSSERQVRAYLYASPLPTVIAANGSITGGVLVQATGQSPAYKSYGWISSVIGPYPMSNAVDLDKLNTLFDIKNHNVIVGSNVVALSLSRDAAIPVGIIDAIRDGKSIRLYTFGRVDYEDAFHKPHWFTYCYDWWGDVLDRPPGAYHTCPFHNDTDQDPED